MNLQSKCEFLQQLWKKENLLGVLKHVLSELAIDVLIGSSFPATHRVRKIKLSIEDLGRNIGMIGKLVITIQGNTLQ